jgi:prepilin-type N-terminal cleavage/methylation domain-containing protein
VRREGGYTLIELLISISIMAILMAGVTNAFFTSNRAQAFMETRLGADNDLLNVSAYFTQDVQSATASSSTGCGGDAVDVGFTWTDHATSDVYVVGYELDGTVLTRKLCRKPASSPEVTEQSNTLGRTVQSIAVGNIPTTGTAVGKTLNVTTTEGTSIVYRAYFRAG